MNNNEIIFCCNCPFLEVCLEKYGQADYTYIDEYEECPDEYDINKD